MTKTTKYIFLCLSFIAFITIVILGTIYDLQISKSIVDIEPNTYLTKNLFSIIFECISENILYLLLSLSSAILFINSYKKKFQYQLIKTILLMFIFFIMSSSIFYCLYKTTNYISKYINSNLLQFLLSKNGKLLYILCSFIINIFLLFILSKINDKILKSLYTWAIIVLIVSTISNGIVKILKTFFCRTRFRTMNYIGDINYEYYTPWYIVNKNKFFSLFPYADDFFKSFPSGHTCAAASSFLLVLLPNYLQKLNKKKYKIFLWIFAISYTFLTALSRIIAGAHFFMDTFVGFLIAIITMNITFHLFEKYKTNFLN